MRISEDHFNLAEAALLRTHFHGRLQYWGSFRLPIKCHVTHADEVTLLTQTRGHGGTSALPVIKVHQLIARVLILLGLFFLMHRNL